MIDLITVYFIDKDNIEYIITKNRSKNLSSKYIFDKNKLSYPIRDNFQNFRINITEKKAYLENSIHKYYNIKKGCGNQNYTDFSFCDFKYACDLLEKEVGFNIDDTTYLTRFEFGFNITLDKKPKNFIEDNVLMYNYKTPCYDPKYKHKEKINKFSLNEYEIKIYDKSLQYNLKSNILRVEVKYKSRRIFNKLGVFKLNDLKRKEVMENVFNDFLCKVKKVIIIDDYKGHIMMNKKEREDFAKYTNPHFWNDLRKNKSKNIPNKCKNKFLGLICKYKLDTTRDEVLKKLISKFNTLMGCNVEPLSLVL